MSDERPLKTLGEYAAHAKRRAEAFRQNIVGARIEAVEYGHEVIHSDDEGTECYADVTLTVGLKDGRRGQIIFSLSDVDGDERAEVGLDDLPDEPITADQGAILLCVGATDNEDALLRLWQRQNW